MTAQRGIDNDRPTCTVADAASYLGVSERSLRRAVESGGDLEHLAIRVGHRVLIKTSALLALVHS
jgi:excisionase family DNA binding protein